MKRSTSRRRSYGRSYRISFRVIHALALAVFLTLAAPALPVPVRTDRADPKPTVALVGTTTSSRVAQGKRVHSTSAQSRPTQSTSAQSSTERTLRRLEDEWASAVVRRDRAAFERLLAPGFVYTENDRLMTRAELIREIVSGSDTVTTARNEGMQVHRFGPTTAVVTGWLILQGRGAGGAFDRRFRYTDTWVRQGGAWRVAAAQDYLVASGTR
jgi:ketosteroid isomerase-like protein